MTATVEQARALFAKPVAGLGEPSHITPDDVPALQAASAVVEAREWDLPGALPWPGSDAAWRAALKRDPAEYLLAWRGAPGEIIAYLTLRRRGDQGLITTAVVDPRRDESALLDFLVEEGISRLLRDGAATVGVEVDAPDRETVQAWVKRGGYPSAVAIPLLYVADVPGPPPPVTDWAAGPACRGLVERLAPGLDVGPDLEAPDSEDAGGMVVVRGSDGPNAFARWRSEPLALPNRQSAQMAVVQVLAAATPSAFDELIDQLKATAAGLPGPGLLVLPTEPGCHWATRPLLHSGFLAMSPDLRLVLAGAPRAPSAIGPVWTHWKL